MWTRHVGFSALAALYVVLEDETRTHVQIGRRLPRCLDPLGSKAREYLAKCREERVDILVRVRDLLEWC